MISPWKSTRPNKDQNITTTAWYKVDNCKSSKLKQYQLFITALCALVLLQICAMFSYNKGPWLISKSTKNSHAVYCTQTRKVTVSSHALYQTTLSIKSIERYSYYTLYHQTRVREPDKPLTLYWKNTELTADTAEMRKHTCGRFRLWSTVDSDAD